MSGKDSLQEYLCMYMPVVVSSGSSIRILYPREYFDSWANPEGPVRTVCQKYHVLALLGFYILENLMILGQIPKVQ
jgi:hypothetical protein